MMKPYEFVPVLLIAAALCLGCRETRRGASAEAPRAPGASSPATPAPQGIQGAGALSHAAVFSLERRADTTILVVHKPWQGAKADFTYVLAPRRDGARARTAESDTLFVPIPVRRAITLTTTNLRDFKTVGALDALVGLGGGRYVCDPEIRSRLGTGRIRDVGTDVGLDAEAVVALKPELLITFVVGSSSDGGRAKLAETGIPIAVEGSYMEESPLGRAEWIKFTAAFLGKGAEADSAFAVVDSSYRALAALARTAKRRPTVFVGAPFGGVWWMASGRTYVGRLLADAGGDYLWASDTTRGSLNLDMEAVLGRAADADFWINAGEWKDLADAERKDPRNALFKAWKEGHVYTNDAIRCDAGGRDFYETGASRPDWILADLIHILHPELLPGHKLRWYRRLPESR
jgi:iron complex transport system substrate-binding protein